MKAGGELTDKPIHYVAFHREKKILYTTQTEYSCYPLVILETEAEARAELQQGNAFVCEVLIEPRTGRTGLPLFGYAQGDEYFFIERETGDNNYTGWDGSFFPTAFVCPAQTYQEHERLINKPGNWAQMQSRLGVKRMGNTRKQ